ncbi:hypothetical protein QN277_019866 [Acacia crassicarpa]|uniref:WIBG Mago-binding domain-containing protein n=1 Tax=Acacia crassicarpa TaxID=499986 RepID=A0AAE1KCA2_9FABA|nr:hypothetical protein QN277_019866 [Acacia crassicarpa]
MANSNGGDDQLKKLAELEKTLKEGERILAPSRRPDGTLRKPIRIRAGYTPQDEVAIYQSKGALLKKEQASSQAGPPGYDPSLDTKPKSKSVKRNERKKEKRHQATLEKEKNLEQTGDEDSSNPEEIPDNNSDHVSESFTSLTSQLNDLAVSRDSSIVTTALETEEVPDPVGTQDIDKRIRALKKKIRLTEALQQKSAEKDLKPEQLEKLSKLEDWRKELKLLEDKKADTTAS